jgi:hypothetical protein
MTPAELLTRLEAISRERPDRVLRLTGNVPAGADPSGLEPCELLIFRGFSSSTTHPTAFDPDQLVTPEGFALIRAELLAGPLNPASEVVLAVSTSLDPFLDPEVWR